MRDSLASVQTACFISNNAIMHTYIYVQNIHCLAIGWMRTMHVCMMTHLFGSITRGSSSEQQSYEKLHRVSDCCAGLVSTPEHESEEVDTLQIIWMRLLFEFNDLIGHG